MDSNYSEMMDAAGQEDSDHGLLFYRCYLCRHVISQWDIAADGFRACPKCGHSKLSPSNLTTWEKAVQIWKHPAVWRWDEKL